MYCYSYRIKNDQNHLSVKAYLQAASVTMIKKDCYKRLFKIRFF